MNNLGCAITRMTIREGDTAVMIPIIRQDRNEALLGGNVFRGVACAAHNVYNDEYWRPCMFPFIGTFKDSTLVDIEKDENTAVLEEYFGISIEDITALIMDTRKDVTDPSSAAYRLCFKKEYYDVIESNDIKTFFDMLFNPIEGTQYGYKDKFGNVIALYEEDNAYVISMKYSAIRNKYNIENRGTILSFINHYCNLVRPDINDKNYLPDIFNKRVCKLIKVGAMFILKEAYEQFATNNVEDCMYVNDFRFDTATLPAFGFQYDADAEAYQITVPTEKTMTDKKGGVSTVTVPVKIEANKDGIVNGEYVSTYGQLEKLINGTLLNYSKCVINVAPYKGDDEYEFEAKMAEYYRKEADNDFQAMKKDGCAQTENIKDEYEAKGRCISLDKFIRAHYPSVFISKWMMKPIYELPLYEGKCVYNYAEFMRLYYALQKLNIMYAPSFAHDGSLTAEMKLADLQQRICKCRIAEKHEQDVMGDFKEPTNLTTSLVMD